jgi:hypothetical protein
LVESRTLVPVKERPEDCGGRFKGLEGDDSRSWQQLSSRERELSAIGTDVDNRAWLQAKHIPVFCRRQHSVTNQGT